jgi:hypothetical protein
MSEGFAAREGNAVDAGNGKDPLGKIIDRNTGCRRKWLERLIEAAPAPVRASLHPDNGPDARTVH